MYVCVQMGEFMMLKKNACMFVIHVKEKLISDGNILVKISKK